MLLLALAFAAGLLDAASYLGLGHVFTANMTGNTVLLAIALARGAVTDAARSATALGGFALGVAAGVSLIGPQGRWPRRARRAFWLEGALLALLLAVWGARSAHGTRFVLIAVSAVAMGAQSAAVRASHVKGVNTTYMTSTFLNAVARLVVKARKVTEDPPAGSLPGSTWAIYSLGALVGAVTEKPWQAGCIAIPTAAVLLVGAKAARAHPVPPDGESAPH